MSDTRVAIGAKGRLVLPAAIRERHGWAAGTELVALDGVDGVALVDRESLKRTVRAQMSGASVVAELIEERRRAAATEGA